MAKETSIVKLGTRISGSNVIIAIMNIALLAIYLESLGLEEYGRFSSIILSVSFPLMILGFFPFAPTLLYFSSELFKEGLEEQFYRKAKAVLILNLVASIAITCLFILFYKTFFIDVVKKPDLVLFWPWAATILILSTLNIFETLLLALGIIQVSYTIKIVTVAIQFLLSLIILGLNGLTVRILLSLHVFLLASDLCLHIFAIRSHLSRILAVETKIWSEARVIFSLTFAESTKYLGALSRKLVDLFVVRYSPYEIISCFQIFLKVIALSKRLLFEPLSQSFFTVTSQEGEVEKDQFAFRIGILTKVPSIVLLILLLVLSLIRVPLTSAIDSFNLSVGSEIVLFASALAIITTVFISLSYLSGMIARILKRPWVLVATSVSYFLSTLLGFVVVLYLPPSIQTKYGAMLLTSSANIGTGLFILYIMIHHLSIIDRKILVIPFFLTISTIDFFLQGSPLYTIIELFTFVLFIHLVLFNSYERRALGELVNRVILMKDTVRFPFMNTHDTKETRIEEQ